MRPLFTVAEVFTSCALFARSGQNLRRPAQGLQSRLFLGRRAIHHDRAKFVGCALRVRSLGRTILDPRKIRLKRRPTDVFHVRDQGDHFRSGRSSPSGHIWSSSRCRRSVITWTIGNVLGSKQPVQAAHRKTLALMQELTRKRKKVKSHGPTGVTLVGKPMFPRPIACSKVPHFFCQARENRSHRSHIPKMASAIEQARAEMFRLQQMNAQLMYGALALLDSLPPDEQDFPGSNGDLKVEIEQSWRSLENVYYDLETRISRREQDQQQWGQAQQINGSKSKKRKTTHDQNTHLNSPYPSASAMGTSWRSLDENNHHPLPQNEDTAQSQPPTPKPKRTSRQPMAPPRRPESTTAYYAYMTSSPTHWQTRSNASKLFLSHIGRIEETSAGMDAPTPCSSCREKFACRVYKPESMGTYFQTGGSNGWRACGHCRFKGYNCSLAAEARRTNPTRREKVEDEVSVVSQRYFEKGGEMPKGEELGRRRRRI